MLWERMHLMNFYLAATEPNPLQKLHYPCRQQRDHKVKGAHPHPHPTLKVQPVLVIVPLALLHDGPAVAEGLIAGAYFEARFDKGDQSLIFAKGKHCLQEENFCKAKFSVYFGIRVAVIVGFSQHLAQAVHQATTFLTKSTNCITSSCKNGRCLLYVLLLKCHHSLKVHENAIS